MFILQWHRVVIFFVTFPRRKTQVAASVSKVSWYTDWKPLYSACASVCSDTLRGHAIVQSLFMPTYLFAACCASKTSLFLYRKSALLQRWQRYPSVCSCFRCSSDWCRGRRKTLKVVFFQIGRLCDDSGSPLQMTVQRDVFLLKTAVADRSECNHKKSLVLKDLFDPIHSLTISATGEPPRSDVIDTQPGLSRRGDSGLDGSEDFEAHSNCATDSIYCLNPFASPDTKQSCCLHQVLAFDTLSNTEPVSAHSTAVLDAVEAKELPSDCDDRDNGSTRTISESTVDSGVEEDDVEACTTQVVTPACSSPSNVTQSTCFCETDPVPLGGSTTEEGAQCGVVEVPSEECSVACLDQASSSVDGPEESVDSCGQEINVQTDGRAKLHDSFKKDRPPLAPRDKRHCFKRKRARTDYEQILSAEKYDSKTIQKPRTSRTEVNFHDIVSWM